MEFLIRVPEPHVYDDREDDLLVDDHVMTPWHRASDEIPPPEYAYDVDEDREAMLGYDTFVPSIHGATCRRAIIVGPDMVINETYHRALKASGVFQSVDVYIDPADVPRRMEGTEDAAVFLLRGFCGSQRISLFHAVGPFFHSRRRYADFSMTYAGATSDGAAWTIVVTNRDGVYNLQWCYQYRIP